MSQEEFKNKVIGRAIDADNAYGAQCVDLFKEFIKVQYGINSGSVCPDTGYAKDIWNCFERLSKINPYFIKVKINEMEDGDWAIWNSGTKGSKYSHVAMFRKDNKDGTGLFLTQNSSSYSGGVKVEQKSIVYAGILGALRPKIYIPVVEQPKPIEQPIVEPTPITPPEPQNSPVEPQIPIEVKPIEEIPIKQEDKPVVVVEPIIEVDKLSKWDKLVKAVIRLLNFIFKGER